MIQKSSAVALPMRRPLRVLPQASLKKVFPICFEFMPSALSVTMVLVLLIMRIRNPETILNPATMHISIRMRMTLASKISSQSYIAGKRAVLEMAL